MNPKYVKNYELREKAIRSLAVVLFNQLKLEAEIENKLFKVSFDEVYHDLKVLLMREYPLREIDELFD